ncbi:SAV_6107 family HEPN domain-containing protein [Williamsia sterculiae]|uniref:SAV-6107-like HEPN domain-containing protein n=1 Tax=Williamsia sterculiae TaxID=1344003 RepID=A0A1N7H7I3_9NOCA|nr:SAV_6107 family HEPN domain-containing protein [Williamsia sterculiae]SIS20628.1 hypothetical protein SAMN05445060_3640 [Williamsia sterculiae]
MGTTARSNRARGAAVTAPDPRAIWQARDLLSRADELVGQAVATTDHLERFRLLYVAALRGAGAALAVRENPGARRTSNSAWARLPRAVPSLAAAASYFAGMSRLRSDIEAGLDRTIGHADIVDIEGRVRGLLDDVDAVITDYERGVRHDQVARSA